MSGSRVIREGGYTIVELAVAISLIGLISVSMIAAFTNYLVIITRNNRLVEMTTESQNLMRSTVEELRYGAGVRQTNSISDPNGPAGGWNTTNSNFVIITAMPALNSSKNYIIDPATGDPYYNEYVYFKQGKILYKRVLANTNAVGNTTKRTCPAALVTSTCPADRQLTENVKTMTFTLYDQNDATTLNASLAKSVKIDLSLERDTFGEPLKFDNTIRVTLRNNFE